MFLYLWEYYKYKDYQGVMMATKYEYMVLTLRQQEAGWIIEYMNETYPRETYMTAMLDYLGLDGWKLTSSTHFHSKEGETENLYFKRAFTKVSQAPKLQALINDIDKRSNTHFVETSLNTEDGAEDKDLIKQKVLKHLYDWLKKHDFEWGEPGSGVRESHYLNKMEDVTDDPMFAKYHGVNKVSTRIDIAKSSDDVKIVLTRRISGPWANYSEESFSYTKEGLQEIQNKLSMQFFRLMK